MKMRAGSRFLPIDEINPSIPMIFAFQESPMAPVTKNPISGSMGLERVRPLVSVLKGLNNTYSIAYVDSHGFPIVDNTTRWGRYCVNYRPGVWLLSNSRSFWGFSGTIVGLYDQTGSYPTFEVLAKKSSPSHVISAVRLTKEVMRVLQGVSYRELVDGGCGGCSSAYHAIVRDCKHRKGMLALITDNTTWFVDPTGVQPPAIEYQTRARDVWLVIVRCLTNAGVALI